MNIEIAYRIPGKGGFRRRSFKSQDAAERFIDKLVEKEGSDVEIRIEAEAAARWI